MVSRPSISSLVRPASSSAARSASDGERERRLVRKLPLRRALRRRRLRLCSRPFRRLPAGEARGAALAERGAAFLAGPRSSRAAPRARARGRAPGAGGLPAPPQARSWRPAGTAARWRRSARASVSGERDQLVGLHQVGDETAAQRSLGAEGLAGQDQLVRDGRAERRAESRCVPPLPGRLPIRTSGSWNDASRARDPHVAASTSSSPPPTAGPLTAAISGLLKASAAWRPGRLCPAAGPGRQRLLEVDAGAKRRAGAGEHGDANVVVGVERRPCASARAARIAVEIAFRRSGTSSVTQATPSAAETSDRSLGAHQSAFSAISSSTSASVSPRSEIAISRVSAPSSGAGCSGPVRPFRPGKARPER